MNQEKPIKEPSVSYQVAHANLEQPVIVEEEGKPVAVLLSMAEYEQYQMLRQTQHFLSATAARRAADRALFQDLVGLAVHSEEPIWSPPPHAQWRVPYRIINGPLLTLIAVDARTGEVALTEEQRSQFLTQVAAHFHNDQTA